MIYVLSMTALSAWADATNEKIGWVKNEYKVTRANLNKYKKQEFNYTGESAEGAGGVGYMSNDGQVKLIEVTYYGETGKTYFEFYFSKNKTFFILEKRFSYNTHFMMTEELVKEWNEEDGVVHEAFDPEKTKLQEWRFYYSNGEVIKTLGPKGNIITNPENAESVLQFSLSNYARLRERLNKQIQPTPKNGAAD